MELKVTEVIQTKATGGKLGWRIIINDMVIVPVEEKVGRFLWSLKEDRVTRSNKSHTGVDNRKRMSNTVVDQQPNNLPPDEDHQELVDSRNSTRVAVQLTETASGTEPAQI